MHWYIYSLISFFSLFDFILLVLSGVNERTNELTDAYEIIFNFWILFFTAFFVEQNKIITNEKYMRMRKNERQMCKKRLNVKKRLKKTETEKERGSETKLWQEKNYQPSAYPTMIEIKK